MSHPKKGRGMSVVEDHNKANGLIEVFYLMTSTLICDWAIVSRFQGWPMLMRKQRKSPWRSRVTDLLQITFLQIY